MDISYELEKGIAKLKNTLEWTLADARKTLEEYKTGKAKVQNKKQRHNNHRNITRELLNTLGLK